MRDLLRKITPSFLLEWNRQRKKKAHFNSLKKSQQEGNVITQSMLENDLLAAGIKEGDTLLVHSSLSKIGFVEGGPKTVVNALIGVVGPNGHILMPNSPNAGLQKEYIQTLEVFDANESKSALGAISEYFRLLPNAIRSVHPTEPVSCVGPEAEWFVSSHYGRITPYDSFSPFYRVSERNGKILYLGVTLDNAGTNLHTLEDAVKDFKYPVYDSETFKVKVRDTNNVESTVETKVHNPEQSAKRKCDKLIPLFIEKGVMRRVKIGEADALLTDAKKMLEVMLEEYQERGVTMYTPFGE